MQQCQLGAHAGSFRLYDGTRAAAAATVSSRTYPGVACSRKDQVRMGTTGRPASRAQQNLTAVTLIPANSPNRPDATRSLPAALSAARHLAPDPEAAASPSCVRSR